MHMTAFHQTEHFPRHPAHLKRFAIKFAFKRIQSRHDIRYLAIPMVGGMWCVRGFGFLPNAGISFPHHFLAKIDPHQIVLENVVVEHVLGGFTQIQNPFGYGWRFDAVGHVLGIDGASTVVIAADPADTTRNEMRIAGILVLHENAITSENRGSAVALDYLLIGEVNFREDTQASDNTRDRIPRHFHNVFGMGFGFPNRSSCDGHLLISFGGLGVRVMFGLIAGSKFATWMAPSRFLIRGALG